MNRYFIYFSYDGANYCGWQMQPNGISVQAVITDAISLVLRTDVNVVAAGRTDSGVHAKKMVAHFDTPFELEDIIGLQNKLNSLLPQDISIMNIEKVASDAHARFDAVSRKYEYHVIDCKNVFRRNYAMRVREQLDFEAMNSAAKILLNKDDFTSFCKVHTDVKNKICNIKYAKWELKEDVWVFTIEADRFLRNMVRAIVGTLLEVGAGRISKAEFENIIEQRNRCKAGVSVPAKGLYLVDVKY